MRPPLRRNLFACLLLAFAALVAFGIWMMMAPGTAGYVQIRGLGNSNIYVQFRDHGLAMAQTIGGLKYAQPIRASAAADQSGYAEYPEVVVPFSAESLPPGVTSVTVKFTLSPEPSRWQIKLKDARRVVGGPITSFRTDVNNVQWAYVQGVANVVSDTPHHTSMIQLGDSDRVTLEVAKRRSTNDTVAFTVVANLGGPHCRLSDIRKAGKSVEVRLRVLDSNGQEIFSTKGPLYTFGFG